MLADVFEMSSSSTISASTTSEGSLAVTYLRATYLRAGSLHTVSRIRAMFLNLE
jgi:hypothetical protein